MGVTADPDDDGGDDPAVQAEAVLVREQIARAIATNPHRVVCRWLCQVAAGERLPPRPSRLVERLGPELLEALRATRASADRSAVQARGPDQTVTVRRKASKASPNDG